MTLSSADNAGQSANEGGSSQERVVQRFPERQDFYNRLHLLFQGRVPDPALFEEAVRLYEEAGTLQRNEMRRRLVQEDIARRFSKFSEFVRFMTEGTYRTTERPIIAEQSGFDTFLIEQGNDLVSVFGQRSAPAFAPTLLTYPNILRIVHALQSSSLMQRHINDVAALRGWDLEKCDRMLAHLSVNMLRAICPGPDTVPYAAVHFACTECLQGLYHHLSGELDYVPKAVVQSMEIDQRTPETKPNNFQPAQKSRDIAKITKLQSADEVERSRLLLGNARDSTDRIRTRVVPQLLAGGASAQDAFWSIHAAHFSKDPFLAHMHTSSFDGKTEYASSVGSQDFYKKSVGATRVNIVTSGWTKHVDCRYLPALEKDFFAALEEAASRITSEDEFLDFITRVEMILITLHLPFDGAGRTCEDFVVYLGQKYGYPLTISTTGYRYATSPLVEQHMHADDAYKQERDVICLRNLGITADPSKPHDEWYAYVQDLLEQHATWRGKLMYDSEMALEAKRLIDALAAGETGNGYATFSKLREVLAQARTQEYAIASNATIARTCDRALAEIRVCDSRDTRNMITALEEEWENDPLIRSVADEFVRPSTTESMLKLARALNDGTHPEEALSWYEKMLEQQPDHVDALTEAGLLLEALQRIPEAEAFYRRAVAVDPKCTHARNNLGHLLMGQSGKEAEAEQCFREVLTVQPDYPKAHCNLARLCRKQGRREEAIGAYEQFLFKSSDATDVRMELIEYLLETGADKAKIEHHLNEVLEWSPNHMDALFEMGSLYLNNNLPRKAQLYFVELLRINPSHLDARMQLATACQFLRQAETAEEQLRIVIAADPSRESAYTQLAKLLIAMGRNEECERLLDAYVERGLSMFAPGFQSAANALGYRINKKKSK